MNASFTGITLLFVVDLVCNINVFNYYPNVKQIKSKQNTITLIKQLYQQLHIIHNAKKNTCINGHTFLTTTLSVKHYY
jgi:hypothetical protein